MIKAVIFDMDGVLMNSEDIHYEVERNILKRFNVDFQMEEHVKYVGQRTADLWKGVCVDHSLDVEPELLAKEDNANYMQELKKGEFEPVRGIPQLIDHLEENGIRMIVASSATRSNIDIVMNKFGIVDRFEGYASGQDVQRAKPNPDIFLLAAEKLGLDPADCLVIEDAKHGVEAAKAAGMICIGYRNPSSGNQDLSSADLITDDINELNIEVFNKLTN